MKLTVAASVLILIGPVLVLGASSEDHFLKYGLHPSVCIVAGNDRDVFNEAKKIIKKSGARALHVFPYRAVFGRFPAGLDESDFSGLPVRIAASVQDIEPGDLDPLLFRIISGLFDEKEIILGNPRPVAPGPVNDLILTVPDDERPVLEADRRRIGTPSEITQRLHNQNSEFMIGRVAINIICPESDGQIENWTEDEFADVLSNISLGLSQYQKYSNWVELDFIYNYRDYMGIPISMEPMQVGAGDDQIWMCEAFGEIGFLYGRHTTNAHYLNEYARGEFGADWAFTAFIVDASDNGCARQGNPYVAYAFFGGPLMLVPYPACSFGGGIGFAHVFIHEMSRVFFAVDEYGTSPFDCGVPSGYLRIKNYNMGGCEAGGDYEMEPCIMHDEPIDWPMSICRYTLGQVGLADDNVNSVPDIYEIHPEIEFVDSTGGLRDTVLEAERYITARAWNDAIRNSNPVFTPEERLHYAPRLSKGKYWVNSDYDNALVPVDGEWDGSSEDIDFTASGMVPGLNVVHLKVENFVGLATEIQKEIFYVGIEFYSTVGEVHDGYIVIGWKTAKEVFGAEFDVVREDLTSAGGGHVIATVDSCESSGGGQRYFSYTDGDISPGHEYRYRIIARFDLEIEGSTRSFVFHSNDIYKTAMLPVGSNLVSSLLPNPTKGRTSFTVDIPKSYHNPVGGGRASRGGNWPAAAALKEVKTDVDIGVYDIKGHRVATVYSRSRYGGLRTFTWDGSNRQGRPVTPGVYFLRIKAGSETVVKKVIIIR